MKIKLDIERIINIRMLNCDFINGFVRLGMDGYKKGWHERNGGNLSYRLSESDTSQVEYLLDFSKPWQSIGTVVKDLKNEFFLVSGSGKFFRNFEIDQEDSIGIIQIDDLGENYRVCWGLKNGGCPTSELPSHLMNHEVKKKITNGKHRVIYHAHTANIIALTFVLPLDEKVFTRELWEMATECPIVFPKGVGIVEWMVPGSTKIAFATSELMKKHDVVIWAHHGTFCSGPNFDITFGLMDTIEKSAEILVKVLSMCQSKRQTITTGNFRELAKEFNVDLEERYY